MSEPEQGYTNLTDESAAYRDARQELRQAEIDLIEQRERVAQLRRALPQGPTVDDYVFLEGPARLADGDVPVRAVRLSELFTRADRALVVYHLMYGKKQTAPCPMCTMWIDGFNGLARHFAPNFDLVIVAAADPVALRAHGRSRGWTNLRLLSAGESSFKRDLGSEYDDGAEDSTVSVFTKEADGSMRHHYTARPATGAERHERGIDLLCPTWHLMDLTPQGRGDWYAQLSY